MPSKLAVIAGLNDYVGTNLMGLNYCANDAEAFYEALIHYGQYEAANVKLFSDGQNAASKKPTYSDILSAVHEMCTDAAVGDSVLFFFAGHGTRDDRDSYLLTKEYRPNVVSESSISMTKINEYFKESQAKFKLRFFDACHSGRMGQRGLPNPNVQSDFVVTAEGWATLAACREDQFAHELSEIGHGVFSYFLVKGLSGAASINSDSVTLDNLRVYVMDQTISLTRKLGLEQTPVFSGEQAGTLTLCSNAAVEVGGLPETLVAIQSVQPEQVEPIADDAAKLLEQLKTVSERHTEVDSFVTQDQPQKLELVARMTSQVHAWATHRSELNRSLLPQDAFMVNLSGTSAMPLNLMLSEFLYKSKIKSAIEWTISTQNKTRKVRTQRSDYDLGAYSPGDPYELVDENYEVAAGIFEASKSSKSTVELLYAPASHLMPRCSMVIALMPSTFGVYLLVYFASTSLEKQMIEAWAPGSFSVQHLKALPVSLPADLEGILNELHARFLSYIVENIEARQSKLVQLGAGPEASIV